MGWPNIALTSWPILVHSIDHLWLRLDDNELPILCPHVVRPTHTHMVRHLVNHVTVDTVHIHEWVEQVSPWVQLRYLITMKGYTVSQMGSTGKHIWQVHNCFQLWYLVYGMVIHDIPDTLFYEYIWIFLCYKLRNFWGVNHMYYLHYLECNPWT